MKLKLNNWCNKKVEDFFPLKSQTKSPTIPESMWKYKT